MVTTPMLRSLFAEGKTNQASLQVRFLDSFLLCYKSHLEPTLSGDVPANKLIALNIEETN